MIVPGSCDRSLPFLDVLGDAVEVLGAVETGFLQVVEQALDGGDGGVDGGGFVVAADGEEEETDELEAVVEGGVETVLLVALVDAQAVDGFDLVDQLVVEHEDVLRLDVGAAVLFEQTEGVAEVEDALEDGLFLRVERKTVER